jgi:methyl-accepting chemotaxis protein
LKLRKKSAIGGKYGTTPPPFRWSQSVPVIEVRDAFYENAEQILGSAWSSARFSFLIALAGPPPSQSRASASC